MSRRVDNGVAFSDDDIDYSDIPASTADDLRRGISVPSGDKSVIAEEFLDRRDELAKSHPCAGSDDIDYRYLRPDAEFWREATLENIDEAMDRLVVRRREEVRSGSADSHKEQPQTSVARR